MNIKNNLMVNLHQRLSNDNEIDFCLGTHMNLDHHEKGFAIKMVLNGQQYFKFPNKEIRLFPDSFLVVAPDTKFTSRVQWKDPVKIISISISKVFWDEFKLENNLGIDVFESENKLSDAFPFQSIYPLVGDMYFNMLNMCRSLQDRNYDEQLLNEYITHCLKIYFSTHFKGYQAGVSKLAFVKTTTKKEVFRRVQLAKEYISNNYDKNFRLDDVAAASCLSTNHLLRTFKQAFGLSPYQYLTIIRLNRAKKLLETEPRTINEIVLEVGFESPSSFIKAFKGYFNLTPLKHKKLFQVN